jgi:hypothetical protein
MVDYTFDPLGLRRQNRLSASRQGRVYDMQVSHNARLMEKQSNNNINGVPDYLDSFKPKDENKVNHLVK